MPIRYALLRTSFGRTLLRIAGTGRRRRVMRVARALAPAHGRTVMTGPFAGTRYASEAADFGYLPRLLGSYESELHRWIEAVVSAGYSRIVNIGCGEGYYAVGLATRLPSTEVFAFDADARSRRLCEQTARDNGVADRVHVAGWCGVDELRAVLGPHTLLVLDAEGGEAELLDPERVPALGTCDVIVELHDFLVPGVTELVTARFAGTHDIELVHSEPKRATDYAQLDALDGRDRAFAVDEFRPPGMRWAFLRSKS